MSEARNLQYRLLAVGDLEGFWWTIKIFCILSKVEKGLETAEKEKALCHLWLQFYLQAVYYLLLGTPGKPREFANADQATKEELEESFGEIDRRLTEARNHSQRFIPHSISQSWLPYLQELSLDPVRRDLAEIKMQLKKVQDRNDGVQFVPIPQKLRISFHRKEEKLDVAVADADREKVSLSVPSEDVGFTQTQKV